MQSIPDPTGSVSDTLLVGTNPAFLIRNNFFLPESMFAGHYGSFPGSGSHLAGHYFILIQLTGG